MMNEDVRQRIKEAGLLQCQVARKMGIFEHDLYRMLSRKPLKTDHYWCIDQGPGTAVYAERCYADNIFCSGKSSQDAGRTA